MRSFRVTFFVGTLAAWVFACGWDPSRPFERNAPEVDRALASLDAGQADAAAEALERYLSTGPCAEGNIGTPEVLKRKPNGAVDLGLTLFAIGESFGRKFGEEEIEAGVSPQDKQERSLRVQCALRVVHAIAEDDAQSVETRARARYLEGNLHFLAGDYQDAVDSYDRALALAPGRELPDATGAKDDGALGRDAAYNRAIALRRIRDKQRDGGAQEDGGGDGGGGDGGGGDGGGSDGGGDSGKGDAGGDSGSGDKGDAGKDSGAPDAGNNDAGQPPPNEGDDASAPPPRADQDDIILQQLERAPTVQQEAARRMGKQRVRGMMDK